MFRDALSRLAHSVCTLAFRTRAERDLEDELRFHIERETDSLIREGANPEEARRRARIAMGGVEQVREMTRDVWGTRFVDQLRQDIGYCVRSLRRTPVFTASVIATLTIALAATTTMVSVIDQVIVRPLVYGHADRLYMMFEGDGKGGGRGPSYQTFLDCQRQSRTFSQVAFVRGNNSVLRKPGGQERVAYGAVTPGFFDMMGLHALEGRLFRPDEERGNDPDIAVISYELWQSEFGGDRAIIGSTIGYDNAVVRVVGVLPPGVTFFQPINIWRPLVGRLARDPALANRNFHVDSRVLGRLADGIALDRALSEFRVIQYRLSREYPGESGGWVSGEFVPIRNMVIGGDTRSMLLLLGAGVLVVLLIACANVSGLAVVRTIAREREFAIHKALGATRQRVTRLLVTESIILGATAGVIALVASAWAIRWVRTAAPGNLPRASELTMDWRVVGIAFVLAVLAGLFVGLASSVRLGAAGFADPLRRGANGSGTAAAARDALSAVQLALAVTLLVAGSLIVQSVRRIQRVDLGYNADHVLSFIVFMPSPRYDRPADAAALDQRLLDAVGAIPGVQAVAITNRAPPGPFVPTRIVVPGRIPDAQSADVASYRVVSSGYLRTLGLSVVQGRWFTDDDMRDRRDGIVISESVAKRYWPDRDPSGEPITIFDASQFRADFGKPQPSHVIGVVKDVRFFSDGGPAAGADVYVPFTREPWPGAQLLVRTAGDPTRVIPSLKEAVRSVDPAIPVSGSAAAGGPGSLDGGYSQPISARRYVLWVLGAFAASALVLALVGVYGVISYTITRRTREFGVRMALGASPARLFAMILGQGSRIASIGVGAGIIASFAVTRLMNRFLFETSPTDVPAFAVVATTVALAVILACAVAGRRATVIDPRSALSSD